MKSTGTYWLGCLGLMLIAGCSGEKTTPTATASGETSAATIANDLASKSAGSPEDSSPGSGGEKKLTIGFSALTLTNPFFKIIADEMTAEAKKHGYEVVVVSADQDVNRQTSQVEDFIVKQVSAKYCMDIWYHSL